MEELTPVKKKAERLTELELDRKIFLDQCKDITSYIMPSKGLYTSTGEKPHDKANAWSKIIDPIAGEDCDLLASGIQGGLSSQSRTWFEPETAEKALMQFESVQIWLKDLGDRMRAVLAGSNFYTKIHDFYSDEGAFGNAVIMCEPDFERIVNFTLLTPGQYSFAEGPTGIIDTVYRRYPMRAVNIERLWPNTCSDDVKQTVKRKPFKWMQVVHAIEPNGDRNPNKIDNLNMPYSSCYWEQGKTEKFLSKGGYLERPFAVGRWKTNDVEAYGTGPGHVALGIVKLLQAMHKTSLRAIHKQADPPVQVPSALKDVISTIPGGITFNPAAETKGGISKLYDMDFNVKDVEYKIEAIKEVIHTIFKRDLFLLIADRPEMTATEVVERSQEKLIMIGPVTERQIPDVLDPVLSRVYNIMTRFNMIPPPPDEIAQAPLKIDYVSLLAQAQKMLGLQGLRSYVDMATAVEQLKANSPDGAVKTNSDFVLDDYANSLSLPPQVTRPPEEVDQVRQMQQQMQQMAQEIEMLKQGSEAAKNLSQADTGGDNALTALTGKA